MFNAESARKYTNERLEIYNEMKKKLIKRCEQLIKKKCSVGEKSCVFDIPKAEMGFPLYNPIMFSDFMKSVLEKHNYTVSYFNGDPSKLVIQW